MTIRIIKSLFLISVLSSCHQENNYQSLSSFSSAELLASKGDISSAFREEEFFQLSREQAVVDFIVMVDASESMFPRLKNLGHSLSDLFHVISDYDWQMGFSSVDHGDYNYNLSYQNEWRSHVAQGKGRFGTLMKLENGSKLIATKILSPKTSNYENIFLHTLSHSPNINCSRPPFCSNPIEQPLRSLKSVIERGFFDNKPLFRSSSKYFISILATNEDERAEDSQRATSPKAVISAFNKQFGKTDKTFLHYSIVIKDKNCLKEERQQSPSAGMSHASIKLSNQTAGPGAVMSLCSNNYGSDLRIISQHIKNKVENSFFLKNEPIPNSVQLTFSKGPEVKWKLQGREIIFDNKNFENIGGSVSYQVLK